MKVIDILKIACQLTGNDDFVNKLESSQNTESEQATINKFVESLNLVLNEIACEYFPILIEEKVTPKNFKVEFSSLSKIPLDIFSVKEMYGRALKFKKFNNYIIVFATEAFVKYSVSPTIVDIDDEIEDIILPERIVAYGVAKEFYLSNSLIEESNVWYEKFKTSLQNMLRRKSNAMHPKRRWR